MAKISIIDTGYIIPSNSGTPLSTSYRVNSGDIITLKSITFSVSTKSNTDSSPSLNTFKPGEVNVGSVENDIIKISGIINTKVSADNTSLYQLSRLPKTLGYKSIFYDSVDSADFPSEQLVNMLAGTHVFSNATGTYQSINEVSTFSLNAQYPCIHVRFVSFNVTQDASTKLIRFDLEGIRLPNEDPTEIL